MASLVTQNTMIDAFQFKDRIRIYLFKSVYELVYKDNTVILVEGKGVNNIWRYEAMKMASKVASYHRKHIK